MYAASALAANTVCRSAAGAAAPLFTQQMFNALGVGGGGSLIAGVAVLLMPIPFVFYKYGGPIRERSKFAPTPSPNEGHAHEQNSQHRSAAASSTDVSDTSDETDVERLSQDAAGAVEEKPEDRRESGNEEMGRADRPRSEDPEKDLEKGGA